MIVTDLDVSTEGSKPVRAGRSSPRARARATSACRSTGPAASTCGPPLIGCAWRSCTTPTKASGRSARSRSATARSSPPTHPNCVLPDLDGNEFRLVVAPRPEGRDRLLGALLRLPLRPARVAGAAVRAPPQGSRGGHGRDRDSAAPRRAASYIEAAQPEHPSLIDATHQMEALFGVVNIPNVVWIDEDGMIVRPPEPGWPGPTQYPEFLAGGCAPRRKKPSTRRAPPEEQRERDEQRATAERLRERHLGRPGPRRVPGRDPRLGGEGRGEPSS